MQRGELFILSAPSGAGKTTLIHALLASELGERGEVAFSVSHTTRPPRRAEREGVDYHFVDRDRFERMVEERRFLEWAEVHGNLYGTGMAEYEKARREKVDLLLDLDVQGAAQVRQRMPEAVTVFILPPSYDVLERRLRGRAEDDEAEIRLRLAAAGREIHAFARYDFAVVNDDLDACVEALKTIIRAARFRTAHVAERARQIEGTFLSAKERETA